LHEWFSFMKYAFAALVSVSPLGKYLLIFATLALLGSCGRTQSEVSPEPPLAVRVVAPRIGPMQQTLRYVGTVASRREINLVARVSGTVTAMPLAEGTLASSGDVLVRIKSPDLEARVLRIEAEAARSQVEAKFACQSYSTDEELAGAGVLAAQQLDNSRRQCASARAGQAAATAALDEVRSVQAYTVEKAPFPGIVLRHHAQIDEPVAPGKPLLLFGDLEREVIVQFAEEDLRGSVSAGTQVLLSIGDASPWRAQVRAIAPLARGPGGAVEVRVTLPAQASHLRHGTSIDMRFILRETPEAFAVPAGAIHHAGIAQNGESGGLPAGTLFLLDGERAIAHSVTLGIEADGWVAVTPALPDGVLVIASDVGQLRDGARVFPVRSDAGKGN
jgi:RND family efflux transporter MFP subunit